MNFTQILVSWIWICSHFSSVQSLSRFFATPWIAACQASLSITNSQSPLRLTSIESVIPSSHFILCRVLLLLPIPPSIRAFSSRSTLRMRWPKYWSFSLSIIPGRSSPGWWALLSHAELEEGAGKGSGWRRWPLWCQEGLEFNPLKGELLSMQYRLRLLDAHPVQGASLRGRGQRLGPNLLRSGLSLGWSEAGEALPTPRVPANPQGCFAPGSVVSTSIQDSPGERDQVTSLLGLFFSTVAQG